MDHFPLSQVVLLYLLRQLSYCINYNPAQIIAWMTNIANAIIPIDPTIALHVWPIFNEVYDMVNHQRILPKITVPEGSSICLLIQVIASTLGM
jgi:enhancer of mRNA-decapping protein 4